MYSGILSEMLKNYRWLPARDFILCAIYIIRIINQQNGIKSKKTENHHDRISDDSELLQSSSEGI